MKMYCKRCKHEWNYKGKSKWYVSCPICKTSIPIKKGVKENGNKRD